MGGDIIVELMDGSFCIAWFGGAIPKTSEDETTASLQICGRIVGGEWLGFPGPVWTDESVTLGGLFSEV